jgi:hypothetical protein
VRRPTIYYVGGERRQYDRETWSRLAAALPAFHENFYNGLPVYTHSPIGSAEEQSTFAVWRTDHKPLLKYEREALSWFFHGVLAAGPLQCRVGRT